MQIINHCPLCSNTAVTFNRCELFPFVEHRMQGRFEVDAAQRTMIPARTLHCSICGFHCLDRRYTLEEESRYYKNYARADYVQNRAYYEGGGIVNIFENSQPAELHNRRLVLDRYLRSKAVGELSSLLDFGGSGHSISQTWGNCSYWSTDISGAELASGFAVWQGSAVDLVVNQQCLEHVSDPIALTGAMISAVKPGGLLYIEVPLEPNYGSVHIHEHINGWTSQSLLWLAQHFALEVLDCSEPHPNVVLLARVNAS